MIIKSLFRRYERWNPVHPTYGAFWGIGVGIGCGVGWGPGFGPDVIGYVGAGCGAGFSVGITFLGLGIGLPANYFLQVPHNAFMVSSRGALDVARARGIIGKGNLVGDGWGDIRTHIPEVLQNPAASFSRDIGNLTGSLMDFSNTKRMLVSSSNQITDCLQRISKRCFPRDDKGWKN